MTIAPSNTQSSYLPAEFQVEGDEQFFRQLIAERERITSSIVNIKENAQYEKRELLSAQQWFSSNNNGAIKTNYAYRTSFDLVALNGGNIGAGVTSLTLTATTQPPLISFVNLLIPLHGFGAATTTGTIFVFVNDPNLYVQFDNSVPAAQKVVITNNLGVNLTQLYWVFEYLKT